MPGSYTADDPMAVELSETGRGERHVRYDFDIVELERGGSGALHCVDGEAAGSTLGNGAPETMPLFDGKGTVPPAAVAIPVKRHKSQAKAAVAVRKWIVIDKQGDSQIIHSGKLAITQQMGVQLRDLRLLDPKLATSYPSAILCRERALVVNLEYIKMIVTIEHAYVAVTEDDNVGVFVEVLQRKLAAHHAAAVAAAEAAAAAAAAAEGSVGRGDPPLPPSKSLADLSTAVGVGVGGIAEDMPFELRILEVALDSVCSYLERLTSELEAAAHPALDSLTQTVTTTNLERVRRIKNRMVRLTTRVETLREVLEKFLDDDGDMHDMNLTAMEAERQQEEARQHMLALRAAVGAQTPMDVPLSVGGVGLGEVGSGLQTPFTPKSQLTYSSSSSSSSSSTNSEEEEAIEQVEMLLEAYFMQVDNTWNKLQTLCEYVDDTEDFINIELDSHRNQLIRLDLMLTAFTASLALVTAMTSLFAMNVQLSPGAEGPGSYSMFVALSVSAGVGAVAVFVGILIYCRWKRLI